VISLPGHPWPPAWLVAAGSLTARESAPKGTDK
jgi:hypothetical protein